MWSCRHELVMLNGTIIFMLLTIFCLDTEDAVLKFRLIVQQCIQLCLKNCKLACHFVEESPPRRAQYTVAVFELFLKIKSRNF